MPISAFTKRKSELRNELFQLEKQIYDLETNFLEETKDIGNIFIGWDMYFSEKSKKRPANTNERLFSLSSYTSPISRSDEFKKVKSVEPPKKKKKVKSDNVDISIGSYSYTPSSTIHSYQSNNQLKSPGKNTYTSASIPLNFQNQNGSSGNSSYMNDPGATLSARISALLGMNRTSNNTQSYSNSQNSYRPPTSSPYPGVSSVNKLSNGLPSLSSYSNPMKHKDQHPPSGSSSDYIV